VLVLALDTATEACLAAVCAVPEQDTGAGVATLASRAPIDPRRHGELLTPLIADILAEAELRPADLSGVVVGLGPGPFTSLRVGIVTAAALADALGIRAVGVCTLDAIALAQPVPPGATLVVATDARRREVYWARYADGRRIAGPAVSRPAELVAELQPGETVVGGGAELYAEVFGLRADPDAPRTPDPAGLVALGLPALVTADAAPPLAPMYLRRPDAVPPGAPKAATAPRAEAAVQR
jgi:tRNA threonylcarbamoyl adenosine modification protein YeaZ